MARPSKLTPEVQEVIVDAILHGSTYKDAAESAGVQYNTFNEWMKKGEAAKTGQYREFNDSVSVANAECARNMVRVIQSAAAKGDWKAALEWLKRRRREDWGDGLDLTSLGEKITKGTDAEQYNRAVSTLADAVREIISGESGEQHGKLDTTK